MSDLAELLIKAVAELEAGPASFLGLYRRELPDGRIEYEVRVRAWSERVVDREGRDIGMVKEEDRIRRVAAVAPTLEEALRQAVLVGDPGTPGII